MVAVPCAPYQSPTVETPKEATCSLVQFCKLNRAKLVHFLAKIATAREVFALLIHYKGHSLN